MDQPWGDCGDPDLAGRLSAVFLLRRELPILPEHLQLAGCDWLLIKDWGHEANNES